MRPGRGSSRRELKRAGRKMCCWRVVQRGEEERVFWNLGDALRVWDRMPLIIKMLMVVR